MPSWALIATCSLPFDCFVLLSASNGGVWPLYAGQAQSFETRLFSALVRAKSLQLESLSRQRHRRRRRHRPSANNEFACALLAVLRSGAARLRLEALKPREWDHFAETAAAVNVHALHTLAVSLAPSSAHYLLYSPRSLLLSTSICALWPGA